MAIDISQHVTNNWPKTEALLSADSDIDYATAKTAAIARAKRDVYGTATPPAEADLEEIVAEWIGDKATIYVIPLGREYYSLERYRQSNNPRGENVTRYDLLQMLDGLKAELEAVCAAAWSEVEEIVGSSVAPVAVPQVDHDGPLLNATDRALARGLPA